MIYNHFANITSIKLECIKNCYKTQIMKVLAILFVSEFNCSIQKGLLISNVA